MAFLIQQVLLLAGDAARYCYPHTTHVVGGCNPNIVASKVHVLLIIGHCATVACQTASWLQMHAFSHLK
jgi:hypothetical protein